MPRYLGSTPQTSRYIGEDRILQFYRGTNLIWNDTRLIDLFDDKDADGNPDVITLAGTGRWTDLGPYPVIPIPYPKLAIYRGIMRLNLPDGLLVSAMATNRARYNVQHPGDDGYIEARVATKGSGTPPPFMGWTAATDVYRRGNNTTGNQTHGVGFRLRQSQLWIVSMTAGNDTERADCGSFAANDIIRLESTGNLHKLYRNGLLAGQWNDTGGLALSGASYRSMILRSDASKDLLGPRRFGPALDWVICQ